MSELEYTKKFVYDSPPPAPPPTESDTITLGLFFDGTLNNKNNTDARGNKSASFQENATAAEDNSYYNDYSNVARLWEFYGAAKRIYVDGIGTVSGAADQTLGFAFGAGETGIRAKVRIGCEEAVKKIQALSNKKRIETLTFDVFGFSRGAAAARNFVYEVQKAAYRARPFYDLNTGTVLYLMDADEKPTTEEMLPEFGHLGLKLKQAGITVDFIVIRFLGIFDTVSSYHANVSMPNFANDVGELHLNEITASNRIVHFTAADEHRENFSLTNIQNARGAGGAHVEKSLPGVHSDIGGSYLDDVDEVIDEIDYKMFGTEELEDFRQRLINEGWYQEHQLVLHHRTVKYNKLSGRRRLSNKYSFIPLHFMCRFGVTYRRPLPFQQGNLENKYSVNNVSIKNGDVAVVPNDFLLTIKSRLEGFVFGNKPPLTFVHQFDLQRKYAGSSPPEQRHADYLNELTDQKNLRLLKNNFLHWSARYEGTGMNPNIRNGERERIVYNG